MPKRIPFSSDHIYHVYNRGVEKRKIFLENRDYVRFIHDLFILNNENSVSNINYYFEGYAIEKNLIERKPRKLLVEILAFALMPNHFHLILRQKANNGIVRFMQKIGVAYSKFFNQKYDRVGSLFQGRFKSVILENESHFLYLPFYVHANPVSLMNGKSSVRKMMGYLESYRWSSHLDYSGKHNFPSVISREFILGTFGSEEIYKKQFKQFLSSKEKTSFLLGGYTLE